MGCDSYVLELLVAHLFPEAGVEEEVGGLQGVSEEGACGREGERRRVGGWVGGKEEEEKEVGGWDGPWRNEERDFSFQARGPLQPPAGQRRESWVGEEEEEEEEMAWPLGEWVGEWRKRGWVGGWVTWLPYHPIKETRSSCLDGWVEEGRVGGLLTVG